MIFPEHRIREQLKAQADLTEAEARVYARQMAAQAQGVISTEDFFLLGHLLLGNFITTLAGGAGTFVKCRLRNISPIPCNLTDLVLSVFAVQQADVWLADPTQNLVGYANQSFPQYLDTNWDFPGGRLTQDFDSDLQTLVDNTLPSGQRLMTVQGAGSPARIPIVLREGFNIVVSARVSASTLDVGWSYRKQLLKVR